MTQPPKNGPEGPAKVVNPAGSQVYWVEVGGYCMECFMSEELAYERRDKFNDALAPLVQKASQFDALKVKHEEMCAAAGKLAEKYAELFGIAKEMHQRIGIAGGMIIDEFCSHEGSCGGQNKHCYADFLYEISARFVAFDAATKGKA